MRWVILMMVVAACATTPPPPRPPVDPRVPLETWVGQWEVARTCLVDPASSLEEGVALAMASGRRCGALLAPLTSPPRVSAYVGQLHRLILVMLVKANAPQSPDSRAAAVRNLDDTIQALVEFDQDEHVNPRPQEP